MRAPPYYLTSGQYQTVRAFAARIVPTGGDPRTDPGAAEVGTGNYIDSKLEYASDATLEGTLLKLIPGALDFIDSQARDRYGQPFAGLSAEVQDGIITELRNDPDLRDVFAVLWDQCIEGFYSDYRDPGYDGVSAWGLVGMQGRRISDTVKDWSFLRIYREAGHRRTLPPWDSESFVEEVRRAPLAARTTEECDVCVVGSGAGGGTIAGKLAHRGYDVILLETGEFYTSTDFTRFELEAYRKLWWPWRFTSNAELGLKEEIALAAGRCVGGSTTIYTAVAHRALPVNFEQWHAATGMVNDQGRPFSIHDLAPYYDLIEREMQVRRMDRWDVGARRIGEGFQKLGLRLEATNAYVTPECEYIGACIYGCPTNAKRGTMVTYIMPALSLGLKLYPRCTTTRVLTRPTSAGLEAYGVEYLDLAGQTKRVHAKVVVLAAGALNTPQLLLRSDLPQLVGNTPSAQLIGANLAVNTARVMFARFPDIIDNHLIYPLTAHHLDPEGDFLLETSTAMEGPLGLAHVLVDEADGLPLWGARHKDILKHMRNYAGIFINIHDANDGRVAIDSQGREKFYKPVTDADKMKFAKAFHLCREAFAAAGALSTEVSTYLSAHLQGTCRTGEDPAKSVANSHSELHDVRRLFVGDASAIPSVIDANPSLTIMALGARLVDYLDRDQQGYLKQ